MLYNLKNILFFVIALVVCNNSYSQNTLPEHLRVDEEAFREKLLNEGYESYEIDELLEQQKQFRLNYFNKTSLRTALDGEVKTCLSECFSEVASSNNDEINIGFEKTITINDTITGSYQNWCRETGIFGGYVRTDSIEDPTSETGYIRNFTTHDMDTDKNTIYCGNELILDDVEINQGNDEEPNYCDKPRFEIIDTTFKDPYNAVEIPNKIYGNYAVKLGNDCLMNRIDKMENTFIVNSSNRKIKYTFSAVLNDTGVCSHIDYEEPLEAPCEEAVPPADYPLTGHQKPYFRIYLKHNGVKIDCSEYMVFGDQRKFEFKNKESDPLVIDWQTKYLDLTAYQVADNDKITVVVESSDCSLGAHYGYAYFDAEFIDEIPDGQGSDDNVSVSVSDSEVCVDDTVEFKSTGGTKDYIWYVYNYANGSSVLLKTISEANFSYKFEKEGYYIVKYIDSNVNNNKACVGNDSNKLEIDVEDCKENPCEDCDSFSPDQGKTYWISAWSREELTKQVTTYTKPAIELVFFDKNNNPLPDNTKIRFKTSGKIIDEWQRIIGSFKIPIGAVFLNIQLLNEAETVNIYYDDVRVHPYDSNMKSFAYDSESYKLMSELDENNFATFYEYDQEGGLIRVKKETEKGVFTIQETRSKSQILEPR